MRLYSYRVARDYGFAPNPFHRYCTLATCKPQIRRTAQVGDWILGTGSKQRSRENHIVYAMHVTEALKFDEYWSDPRFIRKRPSFSSSKKNAYGDNIYHHNTHSEEWIQEDSHHSHEGGRLNQANLRRDTSVDCVLTSESFIYWGGSGPELPGKFIPEILAPGRGHKNNFKEFFVKEFVDWIETQPKSGCLGRPLDWD